MIHDQPFFLEDPSNREASFENQFLLKLRVSNHLSVDLENQNAITVFWKVDG